MEAYLDTPRHPLGVADHPAWQTVRLERERLYLLRRQALYPARKPSMVERLCACLRGLA